MRTNPKNFISITLLFIQTTNTHIAILLIQIITKIRGTGD